MPPPRSTVAPLASTSRTMPRTIEPFGFCAIQFEERVLRQLLDAERDALALGVDRDDDRLDRLALLVAAHGFFAGDVPGEVGQVHQAVDAAGQADEQAEVGDGTDLAADLVAAVGVVGELAPRVRLALLDAERMTSVS